MGSRRAPLVFHFAQLGPASGAAPRYRYRLVGTAAGWVETSANEVAIAALPAGDYQFEIQAVDDDRRSFSPSASFPFRVLRAWWWRWWALLLWGALALLLVAVVWRWRVRALLLRNRRLDETVQRRTSELRQEKRELEQARARLYVQATFDELTGLLNRRAVVEQLRGALADRATHGGGVAVALVDLDHFKRVNDTYGHQVGDEVLRMVAQCLLAQLRQHDRLGRYGGEELLLFMEGIGAADARQRLEAMRQSVAALPIRAEGRTLHVTISVGLAWVGDASTDLQAAIRDADRALYAAKQAGRDRVVEAGGI
jgi:diguanylate cyclase (GGDEF)-like protein